MPKIKIKNDGLRIIELYDKGLKIREIAGALGLTRATIYSYLSKQGITLFDRKNVGDKV